MRRRLPIFYSALLLTAVNLLLRFTGTSFQVFLSGRIGAAGIGLMQLVLSVGGLAMTAGMAGIRTATMYLTAEELGKKREKNVTWVLSGCVLYSAVCSGAVSFCLNHFAPALAQSWVGDPRTTAAIRLYSCFVPVNCLCGVMVGYFTAANRIGTLAAVEIAEQVVSMTVTVGALVFWAGSDTVRACQCVILGSGVGNCLSLGALVVLRLMEKPSTDPRISVGRRLLHTAVPLALADDLKAGISTTENLMVPKRLALYPATADPLVSFGMVCGMVFPILMFPAAILFGLNELLIPELARCRAAGSENRVQYLTRRSLRLAMLYGCLFCGLEFLLAPELCQILYRSEDAGRYLRHYALLIPMLYCDAVTDAMTKGLGQQKACVRYNILTSAMDVAFLFALLPRYGMTGYLFSFFITHLVNFILSLRRLVRTAKIPIALSAVLRTAAATACAVWLASHVHLPVLRGSTFLAGFFAILTLLKVIGKEDVHWIKGIVRRVEK